MDYSVVRKIFCEPEDYSRFDREYDELIGLLGA
jgi:hypothetical protein